MIYAILNSEGVCINRTVWDGITPWSPPEGCTAIEDPDNLYPIPSLPQPETPPAPVDPLDALTLEQKEALIALLQANQA